MDKPLTEDDPFQQGLEDFSDVEAPELSLEILISDDAMQAHINTVTANTSWQLVEQKLQEKSICYGIREAEFVQAIESVKEGREVIQSFLVAEGTSPSRVDPLELYFKHLPSPGKIIEDGSMDFRSRDAVPQSEKDELLACLSLDQETQTGHDIFAREISLPDEEPTTLKAGVNVRIEERENRNLYHAVKAGWPRINNGVLSVLPYFFHDGDVDYRIGNIKFDGDVEIVGDVCSRFRVEASGNVIVRGSVERGAKILAEGNLGVYSGVIGASIRCKGDFGSIYVQESRVNIGGNMRVTNYITDSRVVVGGHAVITDNEAKNALNLSGGELSVNESLDVPSMGSINNRETLVRVGVKPEMEDRLTRYREGMAFCNQRSRQASRLVETLIGQGFTPDKLKRALRKAPEGRRKVILSRLDEIRKLKKLRNSLEFHIQEISTIQREGFAQVKVKVYRSVYPRVTICFGELKFTTVTELAKGQFLVNDVNGPIHYIEG
nr:DUF342 domain-containing protein [Rhodospirillales bacterium]